VGGGVRKHLVVLLVVIETEKKNDKLTLECLMKYTKK